MLIDSFCTCTTYTYTHTQRERARERETYQIPTSHHRSMLPMAANDVLSTYVKMSSKCRYIVKYRSSVELRQQFTESLISLPIYEYNECFKAE